jgi:hypothetical protein
VALGSIAVHATTKKNGGRVGDAKAKKWLLHMPLGSLRRRVVLKVSRFRYILCKRTQLI